MSRADDLPALNTRQRQRSAGSTIAGYQYQFERSVVEVLGKQSSEETRLEGIEDIDLWGDNPEVIQIKYYESQRWSLKSIRDVVYEMLKSFSSGVKVIYVLYVHYGSGETPPERLTVDELKSCLTYSPRGKPVERKYEDFTDEELSEFSAAFVIREGVSLDDQRKLTNSKIASAIGCDEDEAELLHRMRAVQFLHEKAVKKNELDRVVTKDQLVAFLNVRDIMYYRWHQEVIGHDKFIDATVRRLKKLNFNSPNTYRGVLVDVDQDCIEDVADLAIELAKDIDGSTRRRTTSAKPWSLILRGSDELVMAVKRRVIDAKVHFNDGYEHIQFSVDTFTAPAVMNSTGGGGKLAKASHSIRLISEGAFRVAVDQDCRLAHLLVFSSREPWHMQAARGTVTALGGMSIKELTVVLKGVTT